MVCTVSSCATVTCQFHFSIKMILLVLLSSQMAVYLVDLNWLDAKRIVSIVGW